MPIFRKFICALCSAAFLLVTTDAYAQAFQAVVPTRSPFRLSESMGIGGFQFRGDWNVAGKFVIEGRSIDGGQVTPRVVFVPDSEYMKSVPTLRMEWVKTATSAGGIRHDSFDVLTFKNDTKAARVLVGDRSLRNLLSGKVERIQGRAEIVVTGLHVFAECDRTHYMTSFVRIQRDVRQRQLVARSNDKLFSC